MTYVRQCRSGRDLLVNTARGAIVDTEGLREALEAGRLGGAGLDASAATIRAYLGGKPEHLVPGLQP